MEGSPHKGLFKRAPRTQSRGPPQTPDHFQPVRGNASCSPLHHNSTLKPVSPSVRTQMDYLEGLTAVSPGNPRVAGATLSSTPAQGLDICKYRGHSRGQCSLLNPPGQGVGVEGLPPPRPPPSHPPPREAADPSSSCTSPTAFKGSPEGAPSSAWQGCLGGSTRGCEGCKGTIGAPAAW